MLSRNTIGTAPNWDDLAYTGFCEIRNSLETPNEQGNRPFNDYGGFVNFKTDYAAMQIAGNTQDLGFYIRATRNNTGSLVNVPWAKIYTTITPPSFEEINFKGSYVTNTDPTQLPVGISYIPLPRPAAIEGDPVSSTLLTVYDSPTRGFQLACNNQQSPQLFVRAIHTDNSSTAGDGYGDWRTIAFRDGIISTAEKLQDSKSFQISDNSSEHTGAASQFDGTEGVVIKLPDTITANVIGSATYLLNDTISAWAAEANGPVLVLKQNNIDRWALGRHQTTNKQLIAHFYSDTGVWESGHVLLDQVNYVNYRHDRIISGETSVRPYVHDTRTGISCSNNTAGAILYLYTQDAVAGDLRFITYDGTSNHYGIIYSTLNKPTAQEIFFLGSNIIASTTDDTIQNWALKGIGSSWYSVKDQLLSQPSQYGYLINFTNSSSSQIFQLWNCQPSGPIFYRSGNSSGGWQKAWTKILDADNFDDYALPLAGGTMQGQIIGKHHQSNWINVTRLGALHLDTAPTNSTARAAISMKSRSGSWCIGNVVSDNNLCFVWGSDDNYNNGVNTCTHVTMSYDGTVTASKFKGALVGNADTATKATQLTTARTIALTGYMTGSASFNGTANASIEVTPYHARINAGNSNSYPYHRFAYAHPGTGSYIDTYGIFLISSNFYTGSYGIIKITHRVNTGGAANGFEAEWLVRSDGMYEDIITVCTTGVQGTDVWVDVFLKVPGSYPRYTVTPLGLSNWTLVNSEETNNAATHTECWASIADAAIALRGKAYAGTATSYQTGIYGAVWN